MEEAVMLRCKWHPGIMAQWDVESFAARMGVWQQAKVDAGASRAGTRKARATSFVAANTERKLFR